MWACCNLCDDLFCKNLFQPRVAGEGILQRELRLALDQREDVVNEFLLEAVALVVDPVHRDLLFEVGHALERKKIKLADVVSVHKLGEFDPDLADMLSIVIIGNASSRTAGRYMLTPRGYAVGRGAA